MATINSGGVCVSAKPITLGGGSAGTTSVTPLPGQVNLEVLSRQIPKDLRDQIAKLPQEQQVFVYMHHFRKLQLLKDQQSKKQPQLQGTGSKSARQQQAR